MKKEMLLYPLYIVFLLIPIISASPILTFQHEDTQPGETIIATITTSGEFSKQIEPSDIEFYQGRKKISLESDIIFYDKTHYLYIYANNQGDFTIKISNILYLEDGELKSQIIEKNFTISENLEIENKTTNETTTEILSIKPGFIFTTETPKLKLTNKGTKALTISYAENEIEIQPQSSQEIETIPEVTLSFLNFSTYKEFSIPIIYLSANSTFIPPTTKLDLRSSPDRLVMELFTNTKTEEVIQLFNFGNENITDIKIESQLDYIKTQEVQDMSEKQIQNITLTFYQRYQDILKRR